MSDFFLADQLTEALECCSLVGVHIVVVIGVMHHGQLVRMSEKGRNNLVELKPLSI